MVDLLSLNRRCYQAALVVLLLTLPGCCWMSKRSCFPKCPPPDRVVVEVERPCELPPIALETVKSGPLLVLKGDAYHPVRTPDEEKHAKGIFFSTVEAGKLAKNLSELKDWVMEARKRCAIPAGPTSQPSSRPVTLLPPDS